MCKIDEIKIDIDNIFRKCSNYFGLTKDEILHSNREECVDARYCAIYLMCDKYSDYEISKAVDLSKSLINKIRNKTLFRLRNIRFKRDFYKLKEGN